MKCQASERADKRPAPFLGAPQRKRNGMDSQHLNALSVQALYYVADTKMHELDLECLAALPQTLKALQAQISLLQGHAPAPVPVQVAVVEDEEAEIAVQSQPTFSRRLAPAPAALSAS